MIRAKIFEESIQTFFLRGRHPGDIYRILKRQLGSDHAQSEFCKIDLKIRICCGLIDDG